MGEEGKPRAQAADQARKAMERARESAHQQRLGKGPGDPKPGKGVSSRHRSGVDPVPYGQGRDPVAVGDELPALAEKMGWTEQMEVASIGTRWEEIVGQDIARHCEVVSFSEGTLTLQASTTAWAEQLSVVSGRIRQRVNAEIGRPLVARIRILRPSTRSWTKGPRSVKGRGPRDTYG